MEKEKNAVETHGISAEVSRLPSMRPPGTMDYVASTALGAVVGGAMGYGLSRALGDPLGKSVDRAVDSATVVGMIGLFERMAEGRKVAHIRAELEQKFKIAPER